MPLDPVKILCELISVPSVNPMGRIPSTNIDDDSIFYEGRLTEYLQSIFEGLGLRCQRQTVTAATKDAPARQNIIARLEGEKPPTEGGRLLLWEVHQDTVPVTGMSIDPFDPVARDGRIYGRGACDVKGGMAAMLAALSRLANRSRGNIPTIVLACCVNEEHGFTGSCSLTKLWTDAANSALIERRPDAAIVAEPTSLDVVVAHKGTVRWRCHVLGRAAHSSQPELGDNAIYRLARVIRAIEGYQRDVLASRDAHPLCDRPTVSVTTIRGGVSVNTVPDHASIEIDRRLLPGEDPQAAYDELIDYVSGALRDDPDGNKKLQGVSGEESLVQHEPPYLVGAGLLDDNNRLLAERLLRAANEHTNRGRLSSQGRKPQIIGVPYGTDAATIASAGVPTVVFGPGSIEQAHTADEWIDVEQLHCAVEVLCESVQSVCN